MGRFTIISVIAMMFAVWLTFDVYKVVAVPFAGAVHWIPELFGIFLLSSYVAKKFLAKTRWSIFACTIIFPIVCYQSTFGLLTASIFGTAMLFGFLSVDVKKYLQKRRTRKSD